MVSIPDCYQSRARWSNIPILRTSASRNFSCYLRFGVPILKRGMQTDAYMRIDSRPKECYGGAIHPRPEGRGLLAHLDELSSLNSRYEEVKRSVMAAAAR